MKIVILVDGSKNSVEEMAEAIPNAILTFEYTKCLNELREYRHLLDSIEELSRCPDKEILLVNYSGRSIIPQSLGDNREEMIITLSENPESCYYAECPKQIILDLVERLKKETGD